MGFAQSLSYDDAMQSESTNYRTPKHDENTAKSFALALAIPCGRRRRRLTERNYFYFCSLLLSARVWASFVRSSERSFCCRSMLGVRPVCVCLCVCVFWGPDTCSCLGRLDARTRVRSFVRSNQHTHTHTPSNTNAQTHSLARLVRHNTPNQTLTHNTLIDTIQQY